MRHSYVFKALTVLHYKRRIKEIGRRLNPTSGEFNLHFGAPLCITLHDSLPFRGLPLLLTLRLIGLNDGKELPIVCVNADCWRCKKRYQKIGP
jgi:hypothetical protein